MILKNEREALTHIFYEWPSQKYIYNKNFKYKKKTNQKTKPSSPKTPQKHKTLKKQNKQNKQNKQKHPNTASDWQGLISYWTCIISGFLCTSGPYSQRNSWYSISSQSHDDIGESKSFIMFCLCSYTDVE